MFLNIVYTLKAGGESMVQETYLIEMLNELTLSSKQMNDDLKQMNATFDQFDKKIKQAEYRFNQMDSWFEQIDQNLERMNRPVARSSVKTNLSEMQITPNCLLNKSS